MDVSNSLSVYGRCAIQGGHTVWLYRPQSSTCTQILDGVRDRNKGANAYGGLVTTVGALSTLTTPDAKARFLTGMAGSLIAALFFRLNALIVRNQVLAAITMEKGMGAIPQLLRRRTNHPNVGMVQMPIIV